MSGGGPPYRGTASQASPPASTRAGDPPSTDTDPRPSGAARLAPWLLVSAPLFLRGGPAGPKEPVSRALLDMVPGTVFVVDPEWRITYANQSLGPLLGRDQESVLGASLLALASPARRPALKSALAKLQAPGAHDGERVVLLASHGEEVPVEIRLAALPPPGGWGVILRDQRERDALVEALTQRGAELARSNQELDQFASVASHDLQEPLRMVSSFTQLLAQRYQGRFDEDADVYLRFAQQAAERMRKLIEDLLEYSRLDKRARPFEEAPIQELLDTALGNLSAALQASGAVVTHDPLPTLEVDRMQMTQVLQNLIANAIKFHKGGVPHVHVSARQEGDAWVLGVKDDGIGIAPKDQDRIFAIFQRLHTREEYPGSGIGLAICKKVVERHGGKIWVESRGIPGEGTTFRMRVPTVHAKPPPKVVPAPVPTTWQSAAQISAKHLIEQRMQELV